MKRYSSRLPGVPILYQLPGIVAHYLHHAFVQVRFIQFYFETHFLCVSGRKSVNREEVEMDTFQFIFSSVVISNDNIKPIYYSFYLGLGIQEPQTTLFMSERISFFE